jgi:hypothetical protein
VIPDWANPVPETATLLMVTGPVPPDVSWTVFVAAVFRLTLPKATLLAPSVRAAVAVLLAGFSCSAKDCELLPFEAVNIAVCALVTAADVAGKFTLVVPEGIVTDAGTATALLLLARVTAVLLLTACVSVTAHESEPAPVRLALVHVSVASCAVLDPPPDPPEPPR